MNLTDKHLDYYIFHSGNGALDLEKIAKQKAEKQENKQRLLKEIADTDKPSTEQKTSPSDKTRENAAAIISWLDQNNYKLLYCHAGLDGEIFINVKDPNFSPYDFSIEVNDDHALLWINWGFDSGKDPIQLKIPVGGAAQ